MLYTSVESMRDWSERACCSLSRDWPWWAMLAVTIGTWGEDVIMLFWRDQTSAYSILLYDSIVCTLVFGVAAVIWQIRYRNYRGKWEKVWKWVVAGGMLEGLSWVLQLYTVTGTPPVAQAVLRNTSVLWSVLATGYYRLRVGYRNRYVMTSLLLVTIATGVMMAPYFNGQLLSASFLLLLVTPILSAWSHVLQQIACAYMSEARNTILATDNIWQPDYRDAVEQLDFLLLLTIRSASQLVLTVACFGLNYFGPTLDNVPLTWSKFFAIENVVYWMSWPLATVIAGISSIILDSKSANYHDIAQTFSSPLVLFVLYITTATMLLTWGTVLLGVILLSAAVIIWRSWEQYQDRAFLQ